MPARQPGDAGMTSMVASFAAAGTRILRFGGSCLAGCAKECTCAIVNFIRGWLCGKLWHGTEVGQLEFPLWVDLRPSASGEGGRKADMWVNAE